MDSLKCKAILKSGKRKGQECECKVKQYGYCGRHRSFAKTPVISSVTKPIVKTSVTSSITKPIIKPSNLSYFGEERCIAIKGNGGKCENQAYYWYNKQYLCGVHSRKYSDRIDLDKNPNEDEIKRKKMIEHTRTIKNARNENKKRNRKGKIIMRKIRMMREPERIEGYLLVFPNNRKTHQKLGLHLGSLSPMQAGPVIHNKKKCLNLENFHQGNKVFDIEVDENKKVLPIYFERRINIYNKIEAYRYKFKAFKETLQNKGNVCLYSMVPGDNTKYSYLQSRKFYCKYYQELVGGNKQFKQLKDIIDEGTNICIYGYDARIIDNIITIKQINEWYKDTRQPFGHEMVLYCLLMDYKFDFENKIFIK